MWQVEEHITTLLPQNSFEVKNLKTGTYSVVCEHNRNSWCSALLKMRSLYSWLKCAKWVIWA